MRIVRAAQHVSADKSDVDAALSSLPSGVTASVAQLRSGTLVTLEVRRPWHDRRPRSMVVRRLRESLQRIDAQTHRTLIVAAALRDGDRVLAAQRAHPAALKGKWEFPGGKVEPGESPHAALVRECREELDTEVEVGNELRRVELHDRPGTRAVLILFEARLAPGAREPRAVEHLQLGWFGPDELEALDWLESNRQFVTGVTLSL